VFHGRDEFVNDAVQLLTAANTVRLAIIGPGGMGKTTVALALLYHEKVTEHFSAHRLFLSCEALVDADALVVALAKLVGLPASGDLMSAVVECFTRSPPTVLVLDNLETVWLVDGVPVSAVDELLGRIAQIPSVSLIITCRGNLISQSVQWSNAKSAVLEPFSLEAALRTFEDKAGSRLTRTDEEDAKRLLNAVDRMPLAVSLLGQLARRGSSVSHLIQRWNHEHNALLLVHGSGRNNNVATSIELSISVLCAADKSGESLNLLSMCSMLPDGLYPEVFELLRPMFEHIDRARDNICAYALASLSVDKVLRTLSPVRHLVLQRHPPQQIHHDALCSIYFGIADRLPLVMDEDFKGLSAAAAPEMGNLSSLLLTLVDQPSKQVVNAVHRFTAFSCRQRPTVTVALALLPHLEALPLWKAHCLADLGSSQLLLDDYQSAIRSLTTAAELFLELGERSWAAWCTHMASRPLLIIGDCNLAEALLTEARAVFAELGDEIGEAMCSLGLGEVMRRKKDLSTAILHFETARHVFNYLDRTFESARCSEALANVYLEQGNLESAVAELDSANAVFVRLGALNWAAVTACLLGSVWSGQGEHMLAEQLLGEAEDIFKDLNDRLGLAGCTYELGKLRDRQGRRDEAATCFKQALRCYEDLKLEERIQVCQKTIEIMEKDAPSS